MSDYKGNQCPKRGPGLSHTTDTRFRRDGSCVHCGERLHDVPPEGVPEGVTEASIERPPPQGQIFDHIFVWAISDLCARCAKPRELHVSFLIGAPEGVCAVDHGSVLPWTACGMCGTLIEPKLAAGYDKDGTYLGEPSGPKWGVGRGELGKRLQDRLIALHGAWLHGYYES